MKRKVYTAKENPYSGKIQDELKRCFPGYKVLSCFNDRIPAGSTEAITVYAHYWNGEWAGNAKEKYCILYR